MSTDETKGQHSVRTPGGDRKGFATTETLGGTQIVSTPGGPLTSSGEASEGSSLARTLGGDLRGSADHAGPANRGGIDTVGPDGGTACPPVVGLQPTTLGQPPTVAAPPKGAANDRGPARTSVVAQQATSVRDSPSLTDDGVPSGNSVVAVTATVPLRDRLRLALRRHIDPDDDTMPTLCRDGFLWVPADDVLDDLIKAVEQP